jgi:hypothetical protein
MLSMFVISRLVVANNLKGFSTSFSMLRANA